MKRNLLEGLLRKNLVNLIGLAKRKHLATARRKLLEIVLKGRQGLVKRNHQETVQKGHHGLAIIL